MFAVPTTSLRSAKDREAFLRFANWHKEQGGLLVIRLRPERSVLLFGPYTAGLSGAVDKWNGGATRKFKLVGNMVAPVCAREIATIVEQHLPKGKATTSAGGRQRTTAGNSGTATGPVQPKIAPSRRPTE